MNAKTSRWVTENCAFAQSRRIVSFDFDDTLTLPSWDDVGKFWSSSGPNEKAIELVRNSIVEGSTVYIVTSRDEGQEAQKKRDGEVTVAEFVKEHDLPISGIFFTDGDPKGPMLAELGVSMHYDDHPDEIYSAGQNGVKTTRVRHPQDEVTEGGRLPENATEDQRRFWEWHLGTMVPQGD